ncbi:MAG: hypothetical protein KBA30_03390 [Clostridia bacterium]|nr:hypothetical protein [Clostridia bacterium]
MYTPAAATTSNNLLLWLVVVAATLVVIVVSILYTYTLLGQTSRVRNGESRAEIRGRFESHRPFLLTVNIMVIGICGSVICFLLERMNPLLPAEWSFWLCLVPAGSALLCALPVLAAVLGLRSALR